MNTYSARAREIENRVARARDLWQGGAESAVTRRLWAMVLWNATEGRLDVSFDDVVELAEGGGRTSDPRADEELLAQLEVLRTIEERWRFEALGPQHLAQIHALIRPGLCAYRRSEELREHPDLVVVHPSEITDEVLAYYEFLRGESAKMSLEDVLAFVARAHCDLIGIHPFEDGNGSAARLMAVLILRMHRLPYVPIAKVRNDPAWKAAVGDGVSGDYSRAESRLLAWLNESVDLIEGMCDD